MFCDRTPQGLLVRAPAKLNLFLEVLGKRPDGYHDLATLMVAVSLFDTLDLKGFYADSPVAVRTDPELYRMVAEAFPDAWLEDADLNPETIPVHTSVPPEPLFSRTLGPNCS